MQMKALVSSRLVALKQLDVRNDRLEIWSKGYCTALADVDRKAEERRILRVDSGFEGGAPAFSRVLEEILEVVAVVFVNDVTAVYTTNLQDLSFLRRFHAAMRTRSLTEASWA